MYVNKILIDCQYIPLPLFLAPRWRLGSTNGDFSLRIVISTFSPLFIMSFVSGNFSISSENVLSTLANFPHVFADSQRKWGT